MIYYIWFLMAYFVMIGAENCSDYYACQTILYERILNRSRPSIRPIEHPAQNIDVSLGFSLIRFVAVNEDDSTMTVRAHLNQTWKSIIFSWNSSINADVTRISIPANLIWTPKIQLINPTTMLDSESTHFVMIRSDGTFELSYSTLLTIPCPFNFQDYPLDIQNCTFKLGSSLYNSDEVKISHATDVLINDGTLIADGFAFVSHIIKSKKEFFAGYQQYYDQIYIEFVIQRQSKYLLHLINWPAMIVMCLTLTVFLLPPSAFERIIYGSLLLICQLILICNFAFHVPKNLGSNWPWLGRNLICDIFVTSLLLVASAIIRMIGDASHRSIQSPMTKIKTLIFRRLAKLVGLEKAFYDAFVLIHENHYEGNDETTTDSVLEPLASGANSSCTTHIDPMMNLSNVLIKDVCIIKQKITRMAHEHAIQRENWVLALILDRLCFMFYLLLFSFCMERHLFHR